MMALTLAVLLATTPQSPDLKRARDQFEYGAYAEASSAIRAWLATHPEASGTDATEAYRMLGIASFRSGELDQARAAFVSLLALDPDQALDPFLVEPKVVEFFDEVKRAHEPALAPLRERRHEVEEQRRSAEEGHKRAAPEELAAATTRVIRVQERLYFLNWFPFGAGQFQNGETGKGTAIAVAEVLLGAANVAAILYHEHAANDLSRRCSVVAANCSRPPYTDSLRDDLSRADTVKYLSAGLFWAVYAYGVLDAHHHFVPRVESEVAPQGAGVKLSWRF